MYAQCGVHCSPCSLAKYVTTDNLAQCGVECSPCSLAQYFTTMICWDWRLLWLSLLALALAMAPDSDVDDAGDAGRNAPLICEEMTTPLEVSRGESWDFS